MSRPSKFNFIELNDKSDSSLEKAITVNINEKGVMFFSSAYMKKYEVNGKLVKFYGDAGQRMLAWRIIDKANGMTEIDISRSSSNRMLHQNPKSKVTLISIKTILDRLGINMAKYTHLIVQETKDRWAGDVHYVEIPDNRVIKPDCTKDEGDEE